MVKYVVEVAPPVQGKSAVLRNVLAKDNFDVVTNADGVQSLYDSFIHSVKIHGDNICLGAREVGPGGEASPFQWKTYAEVVTWVDQLGSALARIGIKKDGRVGIMGANCQEWQVAMQACNRHSAVCVPLYDTLGEAAMEYIIKHSETTTVFVAKDKLPSLIPTIPQCPGVKDVIVWGAADNALLDKARATGVTVHTFVDFTNLGKAHPSPPSPPANDSICTIMYTSGTTGDPKGVVLTHRTVLGMVQGIKAFIAQVKFPVGPEDSIISYLPMAHILGRIAEEVLLSVGGSIGYWRGDPRLLVDDIKELKPTLLFGVPRIFDRVYSSVLKKVESSSLTKRAVFNWAFKRKLYYLKQGYSSKDASPVADSLVFNKTKAALGGRVRVIVSGSAPLSTHVEEFLKVAMCAPVVQGYGLTESCAASTVAVPDNWAFSGTVGVPTPGVEIRLESLPELGYDAQANPPRGEVCFRGPTVFSGYYKDEKQTKEAMDADGFLHTGDVGELTPEGGLKIIDRKKNMFKLSQGEYVAVERLESVYKQCTALDQIWVYGNSYESVLVAVAVPHRSTLLDWAKENGIEGSFEELCRNPKAAEYIASLLAKTAKDGKLKGFEVVKAVHLDPEPFSVERDLMTPSFKLKRNQLLKAYQRPIDAMYAALKKKEAAAEAAKGKK